ncbi:hypothetical protein BKA63DRAFT_156718 [Paraphoma chrysanthemicola]|nr:hypothetical protein BKA63DRAFT_156718 [Paraphoma chrysanthemicola]
MDVSENFKAAHEQEMGCVDPSSAVAISPRGWKNVPSISRKLGKSRRPRAGFWSVDTSRRTTARKADKMFSVCSAKLRGVTEAFSRHLRAKKLTPSVAATDLATDPADGRVCRSFQDALVRPERKRALTTAKIDEAVWLAGKRGHIVSRASLSRLLSTAIVRDNDAVDVRDCDAPCTADRGGEVGEKDIIWCSGCIPPADWVRLNRVYP